MELDGQIEVDGNSATFSFYGVGSGIESFICKLDGVVFECMFHTFYQQAHTVYCIYAGSQSGTMTDLTPGKHRLRLVPVGCTVNEGKTFRFDV